MPETTMPVIDKIPPQRSTEQNAPSLSMAHLRKPERAEDGTRALLRSGFWITLAGVLALMATKILFGGIGYTGPHTNSGWLSFMFALMGTPFGLMLLVLGAAKWLRNRRQAEEHH